MSPEEKDRETIKKMKVGAVTAGKTLSKIGFKSILGIWLPNAVVASEALGEFIDIAADGGEQFLLTAKGKTAFETYKEKLESLIHSALKEVLKGTDLDNHDYVSDLFYFLDLTEIKREYMAGDTSGKRLCKYLCDQYKVSVGAEDISQEYKKIFECLAPKLIDVFWVENGSIDEFRKIFNILSEEVNGTLEDYEKRLGDLEMKAGHSEDKDLLPKILTNTDVAYANEHMVIHREKEIKKLMQMLSDQKSVLLMNGFGGIGKSALARVIYSKMAGSDQYAHIGWIQYEGNLKQSMIKSISLPAAIEQQVKTPEERWQAIRRLLQEDPHKKLLIIDNVDKDISADQNPAKDKELKGISNWNNMTVLLTSRISSLSKYTSYELGYLTDEEAMDLFYYYYAEDTEYKKPMEQRQYQAEVKILTAELAGNHTLAIELLAKSAGERPLVEYIQYIRDKGFKFPKVKIETEHYDNETVMAEQLKKLFDLNSRTEAEQKCAWNFAVLPVNTQLSQDEAEKWFGCDPTALAQLKAEGWLSGNGGYMLHPLVLDTVWLYRENDTAPTGTSEKYIEYLEKNWENFYDKTLLYSDYQHRLNLVEYVISKIELPSGERKAYIYHTLADGLRDMAQYEKAEKYYLKALQIKEQMLGTDHADTAMTYNNLAVLYQAQGTYEKAEKYYLKASKIFEQVLGTNHPDTATTYHNLAGLYQVQGMYKKAENYCLKALQIREDVLGTDHADTAMTYNNLAGLFRAQGVYEKAERYYLKDLQISEDVLGTGHPDTATTYNNLAGLYQVQGMYEKAENYYLKALQIYEQRLGTKHPFTAMTYDNLAVLYQAQGLYEKAENYYLKALQIREQMLGTNHPDTEATYRRLAGLYQTQGAYEKAEKYNLKALQIREQVLGTDHPDTAVIYHNLAVLYQAQRVYQKAENYYLKALQIYEQRFGINHADTAVIYHNLAVLYQTQGSYEKAEKYYLKALQIKEQVQGTDHADTATTYYNLAVLYQAQGAYKKAEKYCLKALQIREQVLGTDHADTATTYNNLAGLYQAQGVYEKAENYHLKALQIREQVLGTDHPSTATTYNDLALLYYAKKEYKKTEKYLKLALDIFEHCLGQNHPNTQTVQNNLDFIMNMRKIDPD